MYLILGKIKMVSAVGIESTTKRSFNNMQGHG